MASPLNALSSDTPPRGGASYPSDELLHAFSAERDEPSMETVTGILVLQAPPSRGQTGRALFNLLLGLFVLFFGLFLPIGGGVSIFGCLIAISAGLLYQRSLWGTLLSAGGSLLLALSLSLRFSAEDFPRYLKSPGMILAIIGLFLYAGLHAHPRLRGAKKNKSREGVFSASEEEDFLDGSPDDHPRF